jgi:hypothetical protein
MHVRARHVLIVAVALAGSVVAPVAPAIATQVAPPETVTATIDALPEAANVPEVAERQIGDARGRAGATPSASEPVETDVAFSMIGFTLPLDADAEEVVLRTRHAEDGWSEWETLDVDDPSIDGPDPGSAEAEQATTLNTEPLWVGQADAFQVAVDGEVADLQATLIDTEGLNENVLRTAIRHLTPRPVVTTVDAAVARPGIFTRAQWGANESIRGSGPSYASNVTFAIAHHTAGSNNYTRDQSAAVVRGIYEWHVRNNGWSDIGYNILVDKYGQIFEGRFGGLDRGVVGAHAAGFNTGSFGVGVLGNYELVDLPTAAVNAFNRVVAWKYDVHGIDAGANRWITVNNRTIRVLSGHRDVGSTACPGRYFTAKMPGMRASIEALVAAGQSSPEPESSPLQPTGTPAGAIPVPGDWNGDGATQPGWFHGGMFYLPAGRNGATISFRYGKAGDHPVSGDWNGNGKDGIGVFRDGYWYLRNDLSRGSSWRHFRYGRAGDQPVTGDWNRTDQDGVGVFRDGAWFVRNELSAGPSWRHFTYGRAGDVAVTGDWEKLGRDGVGLRRGTNWYVRSHLKSGPSLAFYSFGRDTDLPVMGDWNANGGDTSGIVRGDSWRSSNHMPARKPDQTLTFGIS